MRRSMVIVGVATALVSALLAILTPYAFNLMLLGSKLPAGAVSGIFSSVVSLFVMMAALGVVAGLMWAALGLILAPEKPKGGLAICPYCHARIDINSELCPDCGGDLRPRKLR